MLELFGEEGRSLDMLLKLNTGQRVGFIWSVNLDSIQVQKSINSSEDFSLKLWYSIVCAIIIGGYKLQGHVIKSYKQVAQHALWHFCQPEGAIRRAFQSQWSSRRYGVHVRSQVLRLPQNLVMIRVGRAHCDRLKFVESRNHSVFCHYLQWNGSLCVVESRAGLVARLSAL